MYRFDSGDLASRFQNHVGPNAKKKSEKKKYFLYIKHIDDVRIVGYLGYGTHNAPRHECTIAFPEFRGRSEGWV